MGILTNDRRIDDDRMLEEPPWPDDGPPPHRPPPPDEEPEPTSWAPVDLEAIRSAGGNPHPPPVALTRTDGVSLLYAGKINTAFGKSESGKSWGADVAAAQTIAGGHHVVWVDFEDDPASVTSRLTALGVDWDAIIDRFHYIHPHEPLGDKVGRVSAGKADLQAVLRIGPQLVVVDGLTDALALHGWSTDSNDDYAAFNELLPKRLAATGAAVLLIDHEVKNRDQQGTFQIGAQHKRATTTGAGLRFEMTEPFGIGRHGVIRITITKDKPGHLRQHADDKVIAELHLISDAATGSVTAELRPTATTRADAGTWDGPTQCMGAVLHYFTTVPDEQIPKSAVADRLRALGLSYRSKTVDEALERLAGNGLTVTAGPRKSRLFSLTKETPDALSL